jgi:hypothetical protein
MSSEYKNNPPSALSEAERVISEEGPKAELPTATED